MTPEVLNLISAILQLAATAAQFGLAFGSIDSGPPITTLGLAVDEGEDALFKKTFCR